MARPSQLEGRLLAILDPALRRSSTLATNLMLAGLVLLITLPVGAVELTEPVEATLYRPVGRHDRGHTVPCSHTSAATNPRTHNTDADADAARGDSQSGESGGCERSGCGTYRRGDRSRARERARA